MEEAATGTRDYTGVTTEQIVTEMLTENTGRGICDSGDYYGRHWQRNNANGVVKEPDSTCTFGVYRHSGETRVEPDFTVNLHPWMCKHLEFDPELQARLDAFAEGDGADMHWLELSEAFADHLHELGELEEKPSVVNTYNDPDNIDLSQVLQYTRIALGEGWDCEPTHLIVNVHGGCDVRGGYTAPKCFRLTSEYYEALDACRASYIGAGELGWYIEDGCWRGIEPSDNNPEGGIQDPFKLPAIGLDVETWPEILEVKDGPDLADAIRALDTCRDQLKRSVAGEVIHPRMTSEAAAAVLELRAKGLRDEVLNLATSVVADLYGDGLFVIDRDLYLVTGGESLQVNVYSN